MSKFVIRNPVPTPEQMAEWLGVDQARVEALRKLMREPVAPDPAQAKPTKVRNSTQTVYRKIRSTRKLKETNHAETEAG